MKSLSYFLYSTSIFSTNLLLVFASWIWSNGKTVIWFWSTGANLVIMELNFGVFSYWNFPKRVYYITILFLKKEIPLPLKALLIISSFSLFLLLLFLWIMRYFIEFLHFFSFLLIICLYFYLVYSAHFNRLEQVFCLLLLEV